MRRVASVIVGVLLVLGTAYSGPGHVHAVPDHDEAIDRHVDHVHFGSDHDAHHTDHGPDLELAGGHGHHDAISLGLAGVEAPPKRALPQLESSAISFEPPKTPPSESHERPRARPRDPPPGSRPPGRAPPA